MDLQQYGHIISYITERERKGEPVFWSLTYSKWGKKAMAATRQSGKENFEAEFQNTQKTFSPETIKVDLFNTDNLNQRTPNWSHTFQFLGSPAITLSNIPQAEETKKPENPYSIESIVNDKINSMSLIFQKEMEINTLKMKLEAKDEEIKRLQGEVSELEQEVEEYEELAEQIEKTHAEKEKKVSIAGVNIGDLLTYTAENFLKRNPKVIRGFLGITDETEKQEPETPEKPAYQSTARVKQAGQEVNTEQTQQQEPVQKKEPQTDAEKLRAKLIGNLQSFFEKLPEKHLLMYYDIIFCLQQDEEKIQKILVMAHSLKEKPKAKTAQKNSNTHTSDTNDEESNEEKTHEGEFNDDS